MEEERRRSRLRSFALGGLVGASAALAAARRLRPRERGRATPAGLAAFEEAPCFEEIVEQERAAVTGVSPRAVAPRARRTGAPPASP